LLWTDNNEEIKTILNWVVCYSNEMAEKEIKKYPAVEARSFTRKGEVVHCRNIREII